MKLSERIKFIIFPPKCLACGTTLARRTIFCDDCIPEVPFVEGNLCGICGIEMHPDSPSPICGRCRNLMPKFLRNFPVLEHKGLGRRAVLNFKYGAEGTVPDAAILIAKKVVGEGVIPETVTNVPDTKKARLEKDGSRTEALARYVAKYLGVKYEPVFKKTLETEKQKSLTAEQRKLNVRGAYSAVKAPEGESVLIIDDVFTTGATLNECAKVLKRVYNGRIYTATLTIRDRE